MPRARVGSAAGATDKYWIAGLTYLSAILCTIGLGKPSFYIDEAHSWEFATLPSVPLVVLNAAARDAYPPLYFVLLHVWTLIARDEVFLRMSSVLFHLASIPLIYLVGRSLLGRAGGVAAAALLAVSPFHLGYARELRMYSLLGFLALLSMWGALAWMREGSRKGWWMFTLAGVALLYTHFMGALFLAAQLGVILAEGRWKRLKRDTVRWIAALAVCFLPWSPFFLKAFLVTHGYGGEAPVHHLAWAFLGSLAAGFAAPSWLQLTGLAVWLVVLLAGPKPPRPASRLLWTWALVPPGLALLATLAGKPVFGERTLIVATPAWLLLAAAVMTRGPAWAWGGMTAFGLTAGASYAILLAVQLPAAPAHGTALKDVLREARPGDAIVHSSNVTYHPVHEYHLPRAGSGVVPDFYLEPALEFRGGAAGGRFRDLWRAWRGRLDPGGAIRSGADPSRITDEAFVRRGFKRVWYFATDAEGERELWRLIPSVHNAPSPEKMPVKPFASHAAVARAYRPAGSRAYPGLAVELYIRK